MANSTAKGHLAALVTILIWGTTFISTKVLLVDFQPIEILFFPIFDGIVGFDDCLSPPIERNDN